MKIRLFFIKTTFYALALLTAICIGTNTSFAGEADTQCLTIASNPKKLKLVAAIQKDVERAFEKAGICAKYVNFPLKRIQSKMKRGGLGGEFLRIQKYINSMKDYVIPVPTPIISVTGVLVTLSSSDIKPKKLIDIQGQRVGIIHGTVWQANAVKRNKTIIKGYTYEELAQKLIGKQVDAFMIEELALLNLVQAGIIKPEQIYVSPKIVDHPTYLLLNKRYSHLTNKLDNAIKALKAEGAFKVKFCCK